MEVASIPEKFIKNFNKEEITSHFFQTLQEHGYKIGNLTNDMRPFIKEKIAHYLESREVMPFFSSWLKYLIFEDGTARVCKSQYKWRRFEFYLEITNLHNYTYVTLLKIQGCF